MIASSQSFLTPDEYLQVEEQSEIKHEYRDGQIYAMVGANDAHVTIAGNLFVLLRNHLRGSGCRVYISDMKARLESLNRFYYPDILVTCDPRDRETATHKRFPCLVVEILSDSTEAFDRGDKFADYQTLDSLQEYVLINTRRQRIECFRRSTKGWELEFYPPQSIYPVAEPLTFQLQSIHFEGTIAALYEDVDFPA